MVPTETLGVYHYYQELRKPGAGVSRGALGGVDKKCNYELNMNPPVAPVAGPDWGYLLMSQTKTSERERERERGMSEEIFPLLTMTTVKHSQVLVIRTKEPCSHHRENMMSIYITMLQTGK